MAGDDPPITARLVSEPTRERETYKYDPSLLTSIRYNDDGAPIPADELLTSQDTVLTALAQLGATRLNTARSLISLFDQNWQYIVAEATPTIPLVPGLKHQDRDEDLWLCGTAIPRVHGVCEYTLSVNDPTQFEGGDDPTKLPLALVADLTSDPRFSYKPYCRPGTPARFYAAVPIRTHRGINIGVYCVIDTSPRDLSTWDETSTELMRNISRSLMEHLEYRRFSHINTRNARMIRGLGCFVEGKETLADWRDDPEVHDQITHEERKRRVSNQSEAMRPDSVQDSSTNADAEALHNTGQTSSGSILMGGRSLSPVRMEPEVPKPTSHPTEARASQDREPTKRATKGFSPLSRRQTIQDVFARATRIAREAIEAEGFLVLDASVGSFGVLSRSSLNMDEEANNTHSQSPSTASGEDGRLNGGETEPPCRVLGFSASSFGDAQRPSDIPQKFLSRLLRRHPRGKVFNFDSLGEIQPTDSSGEEDAPDTSTPRRAESGGTEQEGTMIKRRRSPWSKKAEGATLLSIFPGARSVAFIPIWDSKKERWFAGGFAYTYTTTRIFTIEVELSYLRAFGMLTMEESFRIETQLADRAKTDVLNSLSHELRSPLHGILAASELLNDTSLDVFQGNIMHTLETCSRTLLDTLDHLLAFSKVNSYIGRLKMRKHALKAPSAHQDRSRIDHSMTSLNAHTCIDVLVAEVMESVFAGFNFQHVSLSQLTKQQSQSRLPDAEANRRLDSMRALEELAPGNIENGQLRLELGKVSILLDIDSTCSWVFNTQPGAIRRIVMNLFGNSLKYTRHGSIVVSLKQDGARRRDKLRMVKIKVTDTGKGISEDYLRHELFKPFAQEDPLAVGTGLGLSLVKQITTQLKGKIAVDSIVGVGTTVLVSIPLLPGNSETASQDLLGDDSDFTQAVSELQGRKLQLVGFKRSKAPDTDDTRRSSLGYFDHYALVAAVCRDSFKMEVVDDSQLEHVTPDLILYMEEALGSHAGSSLTPKSVPVVAICDNALGSFQRSSSPESDKAAGVIEFISQPIVPRKLAKTLAIALKRWQAQQAQLAAAKMTQQPLTTGGAEAVLKETQTNISWKQPNWEATVDQQATSLATTSVSTNTQRKASIPIISSPEIPSISNFKSSDMRSLLLVDDNAINLKVLSSYINKVGQAYATATNGLEAVETFCQDPSRYKCIFMDISMPVMDGFEATRRIRAHEREKGLKPTPIFALSGLASAGAQVEALESGIDLFLTKPVKLKELGAVLEAKRLL